MCSISLHFHVLMDVGVSSNVLYLEGPNLGLDHVSCLGIDTCLSSLGI
jgi:hypothetical protein